MIISSLDRGLKLLNILANSDGDCRITDLAKKLSINKSSVYRLLDTLASRGYVKQDPETRKYSLDLKIVELSSKVLDKIKLREEAKPFMKELVQRTGETAHLAVLSTKDIVYIDQEESPSVIFVNTDVGRQAPGHCTAIGKVLWAYLPEEELDQILQGKELIPFTARTITSIAQLKTHLRKVKERGYAFDDEEFTKGVRCIAVPVWNYKNKVIASFGISGLAMRITPDRVEELVKTIKEIRDRLCLKLGYRKKG